MLSLVHGPKEKPFPLKPWRPRRRSNVTIAAGFKCKDGLLICADREERSGTSKKGVEKLFTVHAHPWNMTIATGGSAPVGDLAVDRLRKKFVSGFLKGIVNTSHTQGVRALEETHEQIIVDVLTKIYEEHVWKNPVVDHGIQLIIGLSFLETQKQFLYLTHDNIPQRINAYCCLGYGEDLCTYFAERLYHPNLSKDEMILLAAFIFREINDAIQFCGKGTDMVLLRPGELGMHIYPHGVELIQEPIPKFAEVVRSFWDTTKVLPDWIRFIERATAESTTLSASQMGEPEQ